MESVKEFIHVVDTRGLHQHPVIAAHAHGDKLGLEPASVAVFITAARNHFQLAVVALQILKQHHVHVHRAQIIFQDADVVAFFYQPLGVLADEGVLAGA